MDRTDVKWSIDCEKVRLEQDPIVNSMIIVLINNTIDPIELTVAPFIFFSAFS